MKAMVATGSTAPAPSIELADVEEPRLRPDETLVKVEAYSVNRGETFLLEKPPADWRPGKDVAGLVVQAAADGSGPAVGRRVVGHPPQGGWAEYAAVPTHALAELPDGIDSVTAAALPLAGLTALRLLRVAGAVTGRRILMTGASGGVGHYFVELAAAAGAAVTAVTGSAERGARLRELGATEIVHDVAAAAGPFDIVLESTGGENLSAAAMKLRPRGTLVWFGQAGRTPAVLNFFDFLYGPSSTVIRHFSYVDFDEPFSADLGVLVGLVEAERLHPEIGLVTDWTETADVLERLRGRGIRGNAVLTVG